MVILVVAGIVFLPVFGLTLFFALIVFVGAWEWAGLAGLASPPMKLAYAIAILALLALVGWYSQILTLQVNLERIKDILGLACVWWALALLWVRSFPASAIIWRSVAMRMLMGVLVLVPAWLAVVYLRNHDYGVELILLLIVIVAAADIGAYFSGKAWGKAKLAPDVSPGKSWAGFWGGLVTSLSIVSILWLLLDDSYHPLLSVLVVTLLTCLSSVLGDLLESMVKRQQGLKDSGNILPGHGGMMDRLDSMTAAAPVFALSLLVLGW